MIYLAVKDLKKSKLLWEKLASEKEIVITRDGRPCAILIGVQADTVEDSLSEIRRAMFSAAVSRVRRKAQDNPPDVQKIAQTIEESRRERLP